MAATAVEMPVQIDRDLRSARKEWKRTKEHNVKWSYGSRGMSGTPSVSKKCLVHELEDPEPAKLRPVHKPSDMGLCREKLSRNINKMHSTRNSEMPPKPLRVKASAEEEMRNSDSTSRSILDLLPSNSNFAARNAVDDPILYSFDRTETPGKPVALDAYVKTSGRQLEKLIEKEFEILDETGDTLKGRKARLNLRRAVAAANEKESEDVIVDEDGFELL